jgi:RNA polymerase-binding protein DksA
VVTNRDVAVYQQHLQAMMKRLHTRLSHLRDEGSRLGGAEVDDALSAPPLDIGERASHEFEEVVTLGLAENEQHLMEEIDAALARIEDGTFGRCERCGKAISKQELRALPYSRHCVPCTRKEDES